MLSSNSMPLSLLVLVKSMLDAARVIDYGVCFKSRSALLMTVILSGYMNTMWNIVMTKLSGIYFQELCILLLLT